jgi:D-amino peptidase
VRTALLIVDLEGIAGVDTLDALASGGHGYSEACARMRQEVNAAIEGLVSQGFDQVRVSDSHRSGSGVPNLSPALLHPAGELHFVDPDSYGGPLLDDVEAVACVGMHAAAGTNGFAAHTVGIHCAWVLDGRPISETELAWWLAADRGVKAVFASGDDVLGAAVRGLAPYVTTKLSQAIDTALSNIGVLDVLRNTAATAPCSVKKAPPGPITLRFKSEAQAAAAATVAFRTSAFECEVNGKSFTDRYLAALRAVVATEGVLGRELGGSAANAFKLLLQPFPSAK